jgi:transposase-like protein
MSFNITDPVFHDEKLARTFFEKMRWPNGLVCPYCGEAKNVVRLGGDAEAKGQILCRPCRKKFTVSVGTVMERSHVPMTKWLMTFRIMSSSKKGVSAHQVHRMIGVTYKTAWFLCHRVRVAMNLEPETDNGPDMGGEGKIVESDETFVGGKKKNVHNGKPEPIKRPVLALVERGGKLRARHIPNVTAKSVRAVLKKHVKPETHLMTDTSLVAEHVGKGFKKHSAVNHSQDEYVRGEAYTNTAESFFAIVKRSIYGTFHAVSEQHLQRYMTEAEFKWNHRTKLGIEDAERTRAAIRGMEGKRLTYRRLGEA